SGELFIDIDDRGCSIPTRQLPLQGANGTSKNGTDRDIIYARTWSTTTCSWKARISRLGLLVGMNFGDSQSRWTWNLTAISCIPSFWETQGALTVMMQRNSSATQLSFLPMPGNATQLDILSFESFIVSLPSFQVFDTTNRFHTDAFGRAV